MKERPLSDNEMDIVVRTWMQDAPAGQLDRSRVVGAVVGHLRSTRRRRRRPVYSWAFRREATPDASSPTPDDHPRPIALTSGHTPIVIGRTQTMFSAVKGIAAGALVFGVVGVMLVAQPFDQQGSAPGAATDDRAMAPSFFAGAIGEAWTDIAKGTSQRRADGVIESNGESYSFPWEASDPRMAGTATIVSSETDYREGATTLAQTGNTGTMRTLLIDIVNEEGSWEGSLTNVHFGEPEPRPFSSASGWLMGTGAYEGLSAYVVWSFPGGGTFHGHITAEGPPPVPESLPG